MAIGIRGERMSLKIRVFAIIFVVLGVLPISAYAQSADIALVNGKVLTVDADFSTQQAVAIRGERIVSVGSNARIRSLVGSNTKVIDLQGKTLIPGLIDNHVHFIRHALRWEHEARIDGVTSRKKALAVISAKAKSLKPGEWVLIIGGWSPGQFRDRPGLFTKAELDRAAPHNPVFIQQSYRFMILNTLALKQAGIDENFDAPRGWRIARNESGAPTGVIRGRRAIFRFWRRELPQITDDKTVSGLRKLMADFNRAGVTSVFEVGGGGVRDETYEMIRRRLADNDGLSLRIFHTPRFRVRSPEANKGVIERIRNSRPDKSAKMMGNIALGEHMYAPLHDSAFRPSRFSDEDYAEFAKVSEAAADGGWTIHEHAFRDTTITRYLDIFEKINHQKEHNEPSLVDSSRGFHLEAKHRARKNARDDSGPAQQNDDSGFRAEATIRRARALAAAAQDSPGQRCRLGARHGRRRRGPLSAHALSVVGRDGHGFGRGEGAF